MKASKLARIEVLEVATEHCRIAIASHGAQLQILNRMHSPPEKAPGFTGADYAEMIAAGALLALALYWIFSSPSD